MLVGIIGAIDEFHALPVRGNGKTATMTYLLYSQYDNKGYKTYTNYPKKYSVFKKTEELADVILNDNDREIKAVGIDEIQVFYDSYSKTSKKSKYFDNITLIQQSRKKNLDVYYTVQRLKDLERKIRSQTDFFLLPIKYHERTKKRCYIDRCKRNDHAFIVYDVGTGRKVANFRVKDIVDLYDQFSVVA